MEPTELVVFDGDSFGSMGPISVRLEVGQFEREAAQYQLFLRLLLQAQRADLAKTERVAPTGSFHQPIAGTPVDLKQATSVRRRERQAQSWNGSSSRYLL